MRSRDWRQAHQKSKNSVDTFQRIPLKEQSTLSAVALAKADPGISEKINREKQC